jgi:hypothetical protein
VNTGLPSYYQSNSYYPLSIVHCPLFTPVLNGRTKINEMKRQQAKNTINRQIASINMGYQQHRYLINNKPLNLHRHCKILIFATPFKMQQNIITK